MARPAPEAVARARLSRPGESERQDRRRHRRHRRGSARRSRGCSPSAARRDSSSAAATPTRGERVAEATFGDRLSDHVRQGGSREGRRLPQGDRRGRPRFGRVDALVNAAALTDRGNIFDTTEQRFNEIFDVNVRAPFFLIQETAAIMRREKIAGVDRQHPVDVGAWRPAVHHRLLRFEGRARHADPQCRRIR